MRFRIEWLIAAALAVGACSGDDGKDGANGAAGANGANGSAGANGTNGANGTSGTNGTNGTNRKTLRFAPIQAAATDAEKRAVITSTKAWVNDKEVPISFTVEARTNQTIGSTKLGLIVDKNGNAIKSQDGSDFVSPSSDFSSILTAGSKIFEVTHFEAVPGAMYLSELSQDASGKLTMTSTKPIDFSGVAGIWNPCAGSVSPWGTHLGSEEYPPDARAYETAASLSEVGAGNMIRYFGLDPATATVAAAKAVFNPYNYGYVTEVSVDAAGTPTVKKHYAAGRRALELAYVMPDKKTVYLTDDGTNDALYMFVAKTAGDLSEGRLYAARWFQTSAAGAPHGAADIFWVELGPSAKDSEVKALIDAGTKFSDIFETETPTSEGSCPNAASGFKPTVVDVGTGVKNECLKLKQGKELAASRLESRRYAAYLGATTELRKNEGITFNPEASRLYVAFSEMNNGTNDNHPTRDRGGPNHVRLAENPCGAVYQFVIAPDSALGSDYVATAASSLIEGTWLADPAAPNPYPAGTPFSGKNTCSVNGIANPDNIAYLPGYGTLLIGEDSGNEHQNDVVWAYDVTTRELTRIVSTPYGAETTGVYLFPNVNGRAYIKLQVQHPFGETDQSMLQNPDEAQAYVGYLGPFPVMN